MKASQRSNWLFTLLIAGFVADSTAMVPEAYGQVENFRRSYEIESTVFKLCQDAGTFGENKQYQNAVGVLLKAASYDPTSYSRYIHLDLARCYQELNQYPKAVKEAETALKFTPDSERAYCSLAISYYSMRRFDTAISYLDQILKTSSSEEWKKKATSLRREFDVFKNYFEGFDALRKCRWSRAKLLFTAASKYDPSKYTAEVHSGLSQAIRELGDPEGSAKEARIALDTNPREPLALMCMAMVSGDLGQIDDAINWWKKLLLTETDPERRSLVENTIAELTDDRSKSGGSSVNLPDYFESMREDNDYSRWSQKSLPLKVNISTPSAVAGYKPSYGSYITRALDKWCELSGKKLNYVIVASPEKADITVDWTDKPLLSKQKGKDRLAAGITHLHLVDDKFYATAKISIATRSKRSDSFYEDGEVASTCMHEVGHALGLGHSKNVCDVMYYSSSKKQTGLPTKRDAATIARVYQDYPQIGFTPQTPPDAPEVKYLPPPDFLPPPPERENPLPPLFTPPAPSEDEKLPPPLFIPPPPPSSSTSPSPSGKPDKVTTPKPKPKNNSSDPPPPLFTPPPG